VTIAEEPVDAVPPADRLRRQPRQARSRARVRRLIEAAERVLISDGVEGLTTTRVAVEAGVSVGSLYQYLPDRFAVIDALAAMYLDKLEALMDGFVAAAAAQRWPDPVGVLIDGFAGIYRTEPGFRALWFGTGLSDRTRDADSAHKRRMAQGVRRTLVVLDLAVDGPDLRTASEAAVLAADALIQEAFRRDPAGDPALLSEAKTMLRGYLATISVRPPHTEENQ
jgi:AcrR family transcriptional regulator